MHCHCSLKWIGVPSDQPHAALFVGTLLVVLLGLPGCAPPIEGGGGTIEINLVPGETVSGTLVSGQGLRARVTVEADHIYRIRASLAWATAGSTGLEQIEGVVSGAPLPEPVVFSIESSGVGGIPGAETGSTFAADVHGEVTMEFTYESPNDPEPLGGVLGDLRNLIRAELRADYELLITDLGFDDNGTSPQNAVTLTVGMDGERTGTISPGDEGDYFIVQLQANTAYQLGLEATDSASVTSGSKDRFGQVNIGIASAGGLVINGSVSAGTPGVVEFTAPVTEELFLRVTSSQVDPSLAVTIEYAISVVEAVPDGE